MKKHLLGRIKTMSARWVRSKISLLIILGVSSVALATPSSGIVLNQIEAFGSAPDDINEKAQIFTKVDGLDDEDWQARVRTQGATDFYVQHLIVGPGGYGGWHIHPGVLVATVVSGSIDFYDSNCQKHTYTTGQVFTEDSEVHSIINTGSVNTEIYAAYLIKHNSPRRIEAAAPPCAPSTGIP